MLEREPQEHAALMNELMAHQYDGFWQFMYMNCGRDFLEKMCNFGKPLKVIYYYIWSCMITSIRRIDTDNIPIVLLK